MVRSIPAFAAEPGPFLLGRADYLPLLGIQNSLAAGTFCNPGCAGGETGALIDPQDRVRMSDIVDGTANTVMVTECAGRPFGFLAGRRATGGRITGTIADGRSIIYPQGSDDGGSRGGGDCVVNCTNKEEICGFHLGGVVTLRADASVGFLSEVGATPVLVAALVSRAGGEVVTGDY